jgi:hypothetical protein
MRNAYKDNVPPVYAVRAHETLDREIHEYIMRNAYKDNVPPVYAIRAHETLDGEIHEYIIRNAYKDNVPPVYAVYSSVLCPVSHWTEKSMHP